MRYLIKISFIRDSRPLHVSFIGNYKHPNKIKYMAEKKDKSIIIFISKCALLIFLDCVESPRREGLHSS